MLSEKVSIDALVIGAGVVGLAIARQFAKTGMQVALVDESGTFGTATSSRNSEVIHAGLYYPTGSLKAALTLSGREMLYEYCREKNIDHAQIGKAIVATRHSELERLNFLEQQALNNGCEEVFMLSEWEARHLFPDFSFNECLMSPRTGIIDSHTLMINLLSDFQGAGGVFAPKTKVNGVALHDRVVEVLTESHTLIEAKCVINASGLGAVDLLQEKYNDAENYYVKGEYFSYNGAIPTEKLIYPLPSEFGLGIHLTWDLQGNARFGPSSEPCQEINYSVCESNKAMFVEEIRRFWPGIDASKLSPSYSGIRPKVKVNGALAEDFQIIQSCESDAKVINLIGIDSPGLTCCLSIASHVEKLL